MQAEIPLSQATRELESVIDSHFSGDQREQHLENVRRITAGYQAAEELSRDVDGEQWELVSSPSPLQTAAPYGRRQRAKDFMKRFWDRIKSLCLSIRRGFVSTVSQIHLALKQMFASIANDLQRIMQQLAARVAPPQPATGAAAVA